MTFTLVRFAVEGASAEALGDWLMDAGAVASTVEEEVPDAEPIFGEPGSETGQFWGRCAVLAHFAAPVPQGLADAVGERFGVEVAASMREEAVPDTDWVAQTQAQFDPIEAAPGLWIVPSWHQPVTDATNLRLDPGMAFGTGSHPTTGMCLAWLARQDLAGRHVLDYGCGSGILAIAAALLGARRVSAIDIDPAAVAATRENARANGVKVSAWQVDEAPAPVADLVLANILANPLRQLAPLLATRVLPQGSLAIAGLLSSQAGELVDCYRPWLLLAEADRRDGWSLLAGRRS